jgi:thioredoxin reductase (NADPH)
MSDHVHDVLIIGTGVAGLSAAIAGASEGLDVLAVGRDRGQLASSPLVENIPGVPHTSGEEIISRMVRQAEGFGATLIGDTVRALDDVLPHAGEPGHFYATGDMGKWRGRTVVIATGMKPRGLPCLARWDGAGVSRIAQPVEQGQKVVVIGGGNSAAQQALCLSQAGADVTLVTRGKVGDAMSSYLARRIMDDWEIDTIENTEIVGCNEDGDRLSSVRCDGGHVFPADQAHVLIGGEPNAEVALSFLGVEAFTEDEFIITGATDLMVPGNRGIIAAGDVRFGSLRRAQTAIADGVIAAHSAGVILGRW